jgi:hypothetical protein
MILLRIQTETVLLNQHFEENTLTMAKVTITIEGEHREIRRALRRLLGATRPGMERGPCGSGRRGGWGRRKAEAMAGAETPPWTEEELTQLWSEITAGARMVLAEIARRPQGYPNVELQQVLGMPGNAIGGTLSSVGVVSRRFGPRPPVYRFRWDEYRMPPPVAEILSRLAQQKP